jgi:hypothetical protein
MWKDLWALLIGSDHLLTTIEIARTLDKSKRKIQGALVSMSLRGVPIYEERRSDNVLLYGVSVRISDKRLAELLFSEEQ